MKKKTKKVWLELQKKDNKGKEYITGVFFGDAPPQNFFFTYKMKGRKQRTVWLFNKRYIAADLHYEI